MGDYSRSSFKTFFGQPPNSDYGPTKQQTAKRIYEIQQSLLQYQPDQYNDWDYKALINELNTLTQSGGRKRKRTKRKRTKRRKSRK